MSHVAEALQAIVEIPFARIGATAAVEKILHLERADEKPEIPEKRWSSPFYTVAVLSGSAKATDEEQREKKCALIILTTFHSHMKSSVESSPCWAILH